MFAMIGSGLMRKKETNMNRFILCFLRFLSSRFVCGWR